MNYFTKFAAVGLIAASAGLTATNADALDAPFLDGIFNIGIYNYDSAGVSSNANATQTNLDSRNLTDTVTWTGLLDFNIASGNATTTIGDFFASGTGSVSAFAAGVENLILSGGGGTGDDGGLGGGSFRETTLFKITAQSFNNISDMSQILEVTHDDGFTLSDGTNSVANPGPTTEFDTPIAGLSGGAGAFDLIYVAANGDPSVLEVSVVPLPAAAWLLLFASGGLIAAKRRQTKKIA